jgi:tetratricopeptide (TPR) repeat protein
MLAYSLAGAKLAREDSEGAEKLASQALALNVGQGHQHLQIAIWLRERGWLDWSERELRRVIEIGPANDNDTLTAQFRLADLLHDRQVDDAAGQVLEQALAGLDKAAKAANREPEFDKALEAAKRWISSRMHYYLACHYQRQNDRAKEAEQLEAGIKDDPTDADILIGLYRLPEQSEAQRAQTKQLIDDAARKFRAQIAQNPGESNGYNQLAWLLSNTDRDLQEALKASQESLRLRPNEPGFLDTLGRCHFALKDYANAVKFQEQAVAGEPHSGTMRRQLEIFRKALADAAGTKQL